MITVPGWVVRRRAVVLIGALLTGVALQVLMHTLENDRAWDLCLVAAGLLPVVFLVWSAVAAGSPRPAELVARPAIPAFDVPAHPAPVLHATGFTLLGAPVLGMLARDVAAGTGHWFPATLTVLWAGLLVVLWRGALTRLGVRLTPDGIEERQVLGSLLVPWEALATPRAAFPQDGQKVTLFLARPELVRRRGLRFGGRDSLPSADDNAEFVARAIHEYANSPGLRPLIGQEAELDRFEAVPQIAGLMKGRDS